MTRLITGLVLGAGLILLIIFQGIALRIALALVLMLAMYEMARSYMQKGVKIVWWADAAFALFAIPVYYLLGGMQGVSVLFMLAAMVAMTGVLARGQPDYEAAVGTLLPMVYPGLMMMTLFGVADFVPQALATLALLLCLIPAFISDVAAYEIGRRFGKRRLIPAVSPKKTLEGAIAGLIGGALSALICYIITQVCYGQAAAALPLWHLAVIGPLSALASQAGDLSASVIKRHLNIKDYGTVFPGHGGMMDRIDGALFSMALVYAYFVWVVGAV